MNFRKRNNPRLIVDISDTFKTKMKAIAAHKSQIKLPLIIPLRWKVILHDAINGWKNECMYAEVFNKIA